MNKLYFVKPYTLVKRTGFNQGSVDFDGTPFLDNMEIGLATKIVGLLNGAFNLGRYHEQMREEYNDPYEDGNTNPNVRI